MKIHPILNEWMREKSPYNEFKRGAEQGEAESDVFMEKHRPVSFLKIELHVQPRETKIRFSGAGFDPLD